MCRLCCLLIHIPIPLRLTRVESDHYSWGGEGQHIAGNPNIVPFYISGLWMHNFAQSCLVLPVCLSITQFTFITNIWYSSKCSIEFDGDDEQFATARSKLSCLSWNKYSKNVIASSDYEGIATIWDVQTRQVCSFVLEFMLQWLYYASNWKLSYLCNVPCQSVMEY